MYEAGFAERNIHCRSMRVRGIWREKHSEASSACRSYVPCDLQPYPYASYLVTNAAAPFEGPGLAATASVLAATSGFLNKPYIPKSR
jgi:hypothetical protein